jgi:uncharacterized protein (TIGR00369 family)
VAPSADVLRQICEITNASGFYRHLGMKVTSLDESGCRIVLPLRPEHGNLAGTLHGGVPFALVDSAVGLCFVPHLRDERTVTNAEVKINFVRAVPVDAREIACTARVLHLGGRLGLAEAEVMDNDGELVAKALGTVAVLGLRPGRR